MFIWLVGLGLGLVGMGWMVSPGISEQKQRISPGSVPFLCLLGGNLFKDSSYQGGFLSVLFFFFFLFTYLFLPFLFLHRMRDDVMSSDWIPLGFRSLNSHSIQYSIFNIQ